MKTKIITGIIIFLILIISISLYIFTNKETDGKAFKKEYEQYNEKYKKQEKLITLNIDKKNPMIYLDDENIIKSFKGKDKVIYIASPNNNNSRKATKILLNQAKETGVEEIYYYNPNEIKNEKESDTYKEILKKIKQDEIITPTLLLIKNEKVEEIYQSKEINEKEMQEKYERILIKYTLCTEECK